MLFLFRRKLSMFPQAWLPDIFGINNGIDARLRSEPRPLFCANYMQFYVGVCQLEINEFSIEFSKHLHLKKIKQES